MGEAGNPTHVIGRATLGSPDPPDIRILMDGGVVNFSKGGWSASVPEIVIYDSTFVSENLFSGDTIDIEHKRRLYSVIVGKDGVKLAKEIEDLDSKSRSKASEVREKATLIQLIIQKGMSLDEFLKLPDEDVADKIANKRKELAAVHQAEEISRRPKLSTLNRLIFPEGFTELLERSVDGIAEDAETRVKAHMQGHGMHAHGLAWLSEGLTYVEQDKCPFCSQDLAPALTLLDAYQAYFSESYRELRSSIATMRTDIESALGDKQIANFEKIVDSNSAAIEFWSRFCELPPLTWEVDAGHRFRALRDAGLTHLDHKAAAPLDKIEPDATFTAAVDNTEALNAAISEYNELVVAINKEIDAKKASTGAANIKTVEAQLANLALQKKRYEPDTKQLCIAYQAAVTEKNGIEQQKSVARDKLDKYTKTIIGKYEQSINRLLEDFHAGFTITKTEHGYPGGVASSSYQILINGTPVELGDDDTPLDQPSFKNTLSGGDKSTLALSFFLAQLEHDPDRASKIVVFDDPFNSQDNFRKDHTVRKVRECGESCAQVIVLSHDQYFLDRLWKRLDDKQSDRKALELRRLGLYNTAIVEWNVEEATQGAYKIDRKILTDFYHDGAGEMRHVVQKIRPVLEYYTKILAGGIVSEADTLGVVINKIRAAGPTHQLNQHCDQLDELNVYTRRYHHGENPNAATEPIADGELHGYVKKTLVLTGGC